MKYETIREAAHAWVNGFNAIPQGLIEKLYKISYGEEVTEITPPAKYDRVYIYGGEEAGECGEIIERLEESETYRIELDNGEIISVEESDFEVQRDDVLPMWGTMWTFGESIDDWWLEENGGLRLMADCGFRIYEQEDVGFIFGIDGAGYDFYESHWIPLYKARGLHWHKTEEATV